VNPVLGDRYHVLRRRTDSLASIRGRGFGSGVHPTRLVRVV
jgi:hypothetical protein